MFNLISCNFNQFRFLKIEQNRIFQVYTFYIYIDLFLYSILNEIFKITAMLLPYKRLFDIVYISLSLLIPYFIIKRIDALHQLHAFKLFYIKLTIVNLIALLAFGFFQIFSDEHRALMKYALPLGIWCYILILQRCYILASFPEKFILERLQGLEEGIMTQNRDDDINNINSGHTSSTDIDSNSDSNISNANVPNIKILDSISIKLKEIDTDIEKNEQNNSNPNSLVHFTASTKPDDELTSREFFMRQKSHSGWLGRLLALIGISQTQAQTLITLVQKNSGVDLSKIDDICKNEIAKFKKQSSPNTANLEDSLRDLFSELGIGRQENIYKNILSINMKFKDMYYAIELNPMYDEDEKKALMTDFRTDERRLIRSIKNIRLTSDY